MVGEQRPSFLQDHELRFWAAEPRAATHAQGVTLLEKSAKRSQDLNSIESAWREVRSRLQATEPAGTESRVAFVLRLRAAVVWVSRNRSEYLQDLCSSQKTRARDVITASGARIRRWMRFGDNGRCYLCARSWGLLPSHAHGLSQGIRANPRALELHGLF